MTSVPTSRLAFLDSRGHPIDVPREWEVGYIAIEAPIHDWEQITLTRNGVGLNVYARELAGTARVLAEWPRSGTGHYQLELKLPDASENRQIALWPRKITQSSYLQLLEDLERLPPAIAVAL